MGLLLTKKKGKSVRVWVAVGQGPFEFCIMAVDVIVEVHDSVLQNDDRSIDDYTGIGCARLTCSVRSPCIAAWMRSEVQPGLSRSTQAARSAGFSKRMQP